MNLWFIAARPNAEFIALITGKFQLQRKLSEAANF
jgi:hypothetical protein